MNPPIKGMTTRPMGEDYMFPAWYSLLLGMIDKEWARETFKEETGFDISRVLKASGIDAMIDESTGYRKETVIKWADWVTINLWGVE